MLWSVAVALGGLLFGMDTVVISGANLPTKALWHTTPIFHGLFIMSMALWGTVLGALGSGALADKLGRRKMLIWIGILFTVSSIVTAVAPDPYTFSFFRFLGGIAIGASSVVIPTYISEISNAGNRGKLVGLYQFNIVFGILVAFVSNYFLKGFGGDNDWRYMLGVLAIPSVIYSVLVFLVPESPRWLITKKNDTEGAREILSKIGIAQIDSEIAEIKSSTQQPAGKPAEKASLLDKKYKRIISLAFLLAFFNQLSGINFILYYAPEILERAGLASKDSLFNSISIGGINLIFTFVGLYLIDRIGRKTLLLIGSLGYIISLAFVAWAFYNHSSSAFLMVSLMAFIASHAIGQGAVIWVFISEIFPNKLRAQGQSFGCGVHWVFAALITLITPVFLDADDGIFKDNPWPIFAFFSFMMVLQLLWVVLKVPETKGVSLESLQKKLVTE